MGCPPRGRLRAYLDGEVSAGERREIEEHVAGCARCQRTGRLEETAADVGAHLDAVAPRGGPDIDRAWARSQRLRRNARLETGEGRPSVIRNLVRKPAFAIGLVLFMLVGVLSFGEGRALARQLLSVFRVRRFAIVQLNANPEDVKDVARQLEESLFTPGDQDFAPERTQVGSLAEASALAGFEARMPAYTQGEGVLRYTVEGPARFAIGVRGEGLRMVLAMADMDPNLIPEDFVEGEVAIVSTGGVLIQVLIHGDKVTIAQYPDLSAEYPDNLDVAVLVEAGLRVLGMPADEAHQLSVAFDWSSTMLVPVLADAYEVRRTEIAGSDALLVRSEVSDRAHTSHAMLVMEKDGTVYIVEGNATLERLAQITQSLF